jgi:hypothetical protein
MPFEVSTSQDSTSYPSSKNFQNLKLNVLGNRCIGMVESQMRVSARGSTEAGVEYMGPWIRAQ